MVINIGGFVYKAYLSAPFSRALFPDVQFFDIPEYERRVHSMLLNNGILVPDSFEVISQGHMLSEVENVDSDDFNLSRLKGHLTHVNGVPCIKQSLLSGREPRSDEATLVDEALEQISKCGLLMKDTTRDGKFWNMLICDGRVGFYDYKSFFPSSLSSKNELNPLIGQRPETIKKGVSMVGIPGLRVRNK